MSALPYYIPTEDPPEVEEPFLGLLTSGQWIGGEFRYTEPDVLSAVQEHCSVLEEKYKRLEKLVREAGLTVVYDGAGWPALSIYLIQLGIFVLLALVLIVNGDLLQIGVVHPKFLRITDHHLLVGRGSFPEKIAGTLECECSLCCLQ